MGEMTYSLRKGASINEEAPITSQVHGYRFVVISPLSLYIFSIYIFAHYSNGGHIGFTFSLCVTVSHTFCSVQKLVIVKYR